MNISIVKKNGFMIKIISKEYILKTRMIVNGVIEILKKKDNEKKDKSD